MAQEQQADTAKNKVTVTDAGPCKKKISVEIPEESIKKMLDEQYESLRKEAVLPGFRKGRAPRRLLEKRFGKDTSEQTKLKLLAEASDSAVKDNELNVLREPDVDHENIELPESGPLEFDFEVEVRPEFELPKLEGIPVEKQKLEVADEHIDREIEQLCRWSGVWTPRKADEKVQADDQAICDVVLEIEGVEEAEKLNNSEIHVRANGFVGAIPVEKLDELLIGAKSGDTKTTSLEVPKTYFREEYRGKKVDIKIEIKDVKYLKPAELNEDLFKRFGVEDEKQLREKVQDSLQSQLEQQSRSQMSEQIYKYMLDGTEFDLPVDVVADQAANLLQRQTVNLMQRGLPAEKIAEQTEQLKASSEQQAQEQLKTFFIMDKIADKLEIKVSDEEINGHIAQLAIQRGQRPETMREQMGRDGSLVQFGAQIREEKCIAKLLETAAIKEVAAKKKAKKASKKAGKAEKNDEKPGEKKVKISKKTSKTVKKSPKKKESKEKTGEKPAKKVKKAAKKK